MYGKLVATEGNMVPTCRLCTYQRGSQILDHIQHIVGERNSQGILNVMSTVQKKKNKKVSMTSHCTCGKTNSLVLDGIL
jgi:hypothetical protein